MEGNDTLEFKQKAKMQQMNRGSNHRSLVVYEWLRLGFSTEESSGCRKIPHFSNGVEAGWEAVDQTLHALENS